MTTDLATVLHGELYLDDKGEAHFVCHTPDNMTLGDIREATVKFIAVLEAQLDRDDECPTRVVHDAPTAPDSFDKKDVSDAVERITLRNVDVVHDEDGNVLAVKEPERLTPREEQRVTNAFNFAREQERHPAVSALLRYFRWQHLPDHLAAVSQPFCDLAYLMADMLPGNAETTVALRKLLESKDCAVRSALDE